MKKRVVIAILAMVILAVSFMFYEPNQKTGFVKIGDTWVDVEIADEVSEHSRGLMYRDSLGENEGMFFIFDQEQVLNFWMKNVKFNLDLIFLNENFEITSIDKNVKPCYGVCENYVHRGKYVLEVNGGFVDEHSIEEGMTIEFIEK